MEGTGGRWALPFSRCYFALFCEPPGAKALGYERGMTSQRAGLTAIQWIHKERTLELRIWLSPSLACQAVKLEAVVRNSWNVPVYFDMSSVTAVIWGDPDPDLFREPDSYRAVEDLDLQYVRQWQRAEEGARHNAKTAIMPGPPPDWISFGTLR